MQGEFEKFVQEANEFVNRVAEDMQVNTHTAYLTIKSVFHSIRDIITPEESLHLVSQMPMILKALYVDNWKLSHSANYKGIRTREEFLYELNNIQNQLERSNTEDLEGAQLGFEIVFSHLKKYIADGEIEHVKSQFPNEIKELIPA